MLQELTQEVDQDLSVGSCQYSAAGVPHNTGRTCSIPGGVRDRDKNMQMNGMNR